MPTEKIIKTPEEFLNLFNEFREWKKEQKISVQVVTKHGIEELNHTPPLTWWGFDSWLFDNGIITDTRDYRDNTDNRYAQYKAVVRAIDTTMKASKFEGAAVGAFKENIIARELGLSDKNENTQTIVIPDLTDEQRKKLNDDFNAKY